MTDSTILLHYYATGELEPAKDGAYLGWCEDGWWGEVEWKDNHWYRDLLDITNRLYMWAPVPSLEALEYNFGRSL